MGQFHFLTGTFLQVSSQSMFFCIDYICKCRGEAERAAFSAPSKRPPRLFEAPWLTLVGHPGVRGALRIEGKCIGNDPPRKISQISCNGAKMRGLPPAQDPTIQDNIRPTSCPRRQIRQPPSLQIHACLCAITPSLLVLS